MSWFTAAALVLTAAGTGLSIAGQEESKHAQENAMEAEQIRQKSFQKQAENTFADSLEKSGVEPANKELAEGAQRRENAYADAALNAPQTAAPINRIVADKSPAKDALTLSKAAQHAWARAVGGNQASLGAGADWLQSQNIKNARANQNLAVIGNKAAGSSDVSRLEVEQAGHAGDAYGQIGQILSAAGMLVGVGGAVGALGGATSGGLTAEQSAAMAAGYGPVSASRAVSLAPTVNSINSLNTILPAASAYPSVWSALRY